MKLPNRDVLYLPYLYCLPGFFSPLVFLPLDTQEFVRLSFPVVFCNTLDKEKTIHYPPGQVRTVQVAFIAASGEKQLVSLQTKRMGGSRYHDSYEALLKGPTSEALRLGMVSYIHPKTSLVGVTLSNKILFVDVSKEFLQSKDIAKATEQLTATALAFDQVKDLVILVEGELLSQ